MAENLFKVFFIITYESNLSKKIEYSLSNESGIENLKISFTKKIKNDDKKEYIISVLSFDINNPKEEYRDKNNLFNAFINFNIQSNIYKKQISLKKEEITIYLIFELKIIII